ncbi:MAG: hypothetical protein JNL63_06280, partial [Bacteroidia bacterium]|nr:hypothetical protein [Bacteroidia bacterium]
MEAKKCQYCNEEIQGRRDDAKFCSNTCKARHWEEQKEKPPVKEEKSVASELRGVLSKDDKPGLPAIPDQQKPAIQTREVKKPNMLHWRTKMEYHRILKVQTQSLTEIHALEKKLKELNFNNGNGWLWGLSGAGALLGNKVAENKTGGALMGAIFGLAAGMFAKDITKDAREEEKRQQAEEIIKQIQSKVNGLKETEKALQKAKQTVDALPPFDIVQEKVPVLPKTFDELISPAPGTSPPAPPDQVSDHDPLKPFNRRQTDASDVSLTDINDKIISSRSLKDMDFKALNFQNKWQNLFGFPSINFHCVIHGMSGEGKSTFAIQLAKYLADNFGKVIYVSGEEGFSKTFTDKFLNNHADSQFLDVADLRTFDDILKEVKPESYNFIFIDSLDNMKIDADKMKKIRAAYKNSA